MLFEPGQQLVDLLVILDGSLELIDTSGDQERILAVHGTRGFVGEIGLLTGRTATSLCRVKSAAEVIRIPVDALRRLLVSSASFADKWMTSLLRRREVILARGVDGLHVFGDRADAATLRLREFMHRNGVPHRWIIENYAGFPAGISGTELALRSYLQALKFGAMFSAPCDVAEIRRADDGLHSVHLEDGSVANTKTVIVATGVRYRSLGVKGLSKLSGTGVYYSATHVEALLCDERPLHVIGAGNSAGQAAMFLSRFNAKVYLIVRGGDLRKSMSSYLAERVTANSRIQVRLHSELRAVTGADSLDRVSIENVAMSETTVEDSCAVFIFIGAAPAPTFLVTG